MPYTKTITVYSRQERKNFHARGIWIDRDGNQIPVRSMTKERLSKLVSMLFNWAAKDADMYNGNVYENLRAHLLFPHIILRIHDTGLCSFESEMFLDAYRFHRE